MADIRSFMFVCHLRAESSSHVLHYRNGRLVHQGRGLSYWFLPMSAAIAEIPMDDRELSLCVSARSSDFQDVSVQGALGWRVVDPIALCERVDFGIDPKRGVHLRQPLDAIALRLSQLAQQHAAEWVGGRALRDVLRQGPSEIRERVLSALESDASVSELGIALTSVRISSVAPTPDLERALEAPMREKIQEDADQAAFSRRALAVEKERAIQENELQNRIELSRREEQLVAQEGQNTRRRATETAAAKRIEVEAGAEASRMQAEARAESIRLVEGAQVEQERARMEIQRREVAGKLQRIEHLHLGMGGDSLGPLLAELAGAGTRALERGER